MRASRLLPIPLACAALAACGDHGPENTLFALRAGYDAAVLAPAASYRRLPVCAAGHGATVASPCADPAVVLALQKADLSAEAALDAAETVVRGNPQVDAATFIGAARQAVTAAEQIVAIYGVK